MANDSESKSTIALEIERLKKATIEAAAKRDQLPQPLFWSLFHSSLKEIRKAKEEERVLSQLLES